MDKKKIKVILLLIGLILFQSLIYFITKLLQGEPHLLSTTLDNSLPYISGFVYFYILWYVMLFIVPLVIYIKGKESFYKYITTYVISVIVCGVIFIVYPTTIIRPEIVTSGLSNKLVNLLYLMDQPAINCLPSIHCLIAFLFMFGITKVDISKIYKVLVYIISIAIVLSTFFIKQHVIYDAVASFVIIVVVWSIVSITGLYKKIEKLLSKEVAR